MAARLIHQINAAAEVVSRRRLAKSHDEEAGWTAPRIYHGAAASANGGHFAASRTFPPR
jgi:hypothetical protein